MNRIMRVMLVPAVALFASQVTACAGNPGPGESGYRFNLNGSYETVIEVQGTRYTGETSLATAPGGVVTGSILLTQPGEVIADVSGTVSDSTFTFESAYLRDGGCGGMLTGTAAIEPEGAAAEGPVEIADDCAGGVMEGTFGLKRPLND